jgi:hypothetical protein
MLFYPIFIENKEISNAIRSLDLAVVAFLSGVYICRRRSNQKRMLKEEELENEARAGAYLFDCSDVSAE